MKTDEIRERYLRFFEKKGHTIWPSDSLIPENDPTLLFTGAGMNQFKDDFLGKGKHPFKRATTSQKCVRTGDVEKVGKTNAHQTFFEMLGNFSFGDYFKKEAIAWAWEFLTREMKIDGTKLAVTVYKDDDEAYAAWRDDIKVPESRIWRYGESDNFWPASAPSEGPNGPCGPCSEIYFDRSGGCGQKDCQPSCPCGRYTEVWNLVFTQFDRQDGGVLEPLPQKNIDTGMGLERIAAVMQGVVSNFDTDTFKKIIASTSDLLGVQYEPKQEAGARMRRIADHVRAATFMICDGVLPLNTGRGSVLRTVLRRASTAGYLLGQKSPFLYRIVPVVVDAMKKGYQVLVERQEMIAGHVKGEETAFLAALHRAVGELDLEVEALRKDGKVEFPGELAADLNQTHGMPLEILELFLADRGFRLDRPGYEQAREKHERVSKAGGMAEGAVFAGGPLAEVKGFSKGTEFLGYEALHAKVRVIAIIKDEKLVDAAHDGDLVTVICDKTPFYGESGGQLGDQGLLKGAGVEVRIEDTKKIEAYHTHVGHVKTGSVRKGDEIEAQVDAARRAGVMRNHTATHILQWALRTVAGQGVIQQGSLVAPDRLRFDFTHFQSLTREELSRIEELVNERIVENSPLKVQEMGFDEAKKDGALAFFEKYGDKVRVVNVGGFSKELCGGTHVKRTGDIGYFRIVSEGSIASGVRRIEALTGPSAVRRAQDARGALEEAASMLSVPADRVLEKLGAVLDEVKGLKAQIVKAQKQAASQAVAGISAQAEEVGGVRVLVQRHEGKGVDELRALADAFRKANPSSAVCLVSTAEEKATLIVGYTTDLVGKGLDAGATVRTVAKIIGGSGGGKKDFAQAGGKDPSKADEALAAFRAHLAEALNK